MTTILQQAIAAGCSFESNQQVNTATLRVNGAGGYFDLSQTWVCDTTFALTRIPFLTTPVPNGNFVLAKAACVPACWMGPTNFSVATTTDNPTGGTLTDGVTTYPIFTNFSAVAQFNVSTGSATLSFQIIRFDTNGGPAIPTFAFDSSYDSTQTVACDKRGIYTFSVTVGDGITFSSTLNFTITLS